MASTGPTASIPVNLLDPLLVISWEDAYSGILPTIFVGIVDDNYTDVMFEEHANRLKKLFTVDPVATASIKISGIQRAGNNVVDDSALAEAVKAAMHVLNHLETKVIRIVGLGRGSAVVVGHSLEYLIRAWDIEPSQKQIQFVALGESEDFHYLNFCKALCLKKICKTIQFYCTRYYNIFGCLEEDSIMAPRNDTVSSFVKMQRMLTALEDNKSE